MNAMVYDIEIVKAIQGRNEERIPGIEYCAGWQDHANMGVSVIGVYDFVSHRYRVFCKDNFDEFFALAAQRSVLVSFNGVGFDNKVLRWIPSGASFDLSASAYDILREIWVCLGLNPDKFYWKTHGGLGLDAVCEANYLGKKSGHGALAPIQWQRGEIGAVIDYCLNDVKMTKDLFEACQAGPIANPKGGELELRKITNG
jgi:hypothetical protein